MFIKYPEDWATVIFLIRNRLECGLMIITTKISGINNYFDGTNIIDNKNSGYIST